MTNRLRTTLAAAATFGFVALAQSASAFGFNICEDVTIKVENNLSGPIEIYDIDYYDYAKKLWRSEPTSNETVSPHSTWSKERNLEKVEGARTRIRVKYRTFDDQYQFKVKDSAKSSKAVCDKGDTFTVKIG